MVVKERIVVDLLFNDINTCVKSVKEWFNSKGYKKITARNPDRWSTAVILDIAKGGLMSKTTIQTIFKSHAGGSSIMIEYIASNDGTGLSGKPVTSMAPDPKDKPYEALAMELSQFVKSTWKRGAGPGLSAEQMPSTMYQTSAPSYTSPALQQNQQQGYQYQQYGSYQQQPQTAYDASGSYSQQSYQQQPVAPSSTGHNLSDEEAAMLEAQLAQEEQAQQVMPGPEPQQELPVAAPQTYETPEVTPAAVEEDIPPEKPTIFSAPVDTPTAVEEEYPQTKPISYGTPEVTPADVEEEVPPEKPITFSTPEVAPPVVEPQTYQAPPPAVPEPEVPQPPQVEPPAPEPLTPEPVLEPKPEIAPVEAKPEPVVQPVQPMVPTESVCPGCGKKTKPRWKTCPYCETDLTGTKKVEPAVEATTPEPVVQPTPEPVVEQPQVMTQPQETPAVNVTPTIPTCPTCGQVATWIEDYKRYYCYTCQQYL